MREDRARGRRRLLVHLKEASGALELPLLRRGEQPVSAHAVHLLREHVLQNAVQEGVRWQRLVHGLPGAMALESECDILFVKALESAVWKRTLEEVAPQVGQDLRARARVLHVDHPRCAPRFVRQACGEGGHFECLVHQAAKEGGEHAARKEEAPALARDEARAVRAEASGRDQQVRVWMVAEVAPVGMQHREHRGARAQVRRVGGDGEDGLGCAAQEGVITSRCCARARGRSAAGSVKVSKKWSVGSRRSC